MAKKIHDISLENQYDFFYVTLVEDKNDRSKSRLVNDYNRVGWPTVYVDGGYEVVFGANDFENNFKKSLSTAASRNRPEVYVKVDPVWDNDVLECNVKVVNKDNIDYNGIVRVYICEKRSVRWSDNDGNPYHNALLDYLEKDYVKVESNSNFSFTETWTPPEEFSDISQENLWTVAVVFDSKSKQRYSNPVDNTNSFNAFFAVDADAADVSEDGSLPPGLGFVKPKQMHHYIFNREKKNLFLSSTWMIGKTSLEVNVESEEKVEKVEFEIDGWIGDKKVSVEQKPFRYKWQSFALGPYTITATVYDNKGRTASDSIEVFAFIL